MNELEIREQLQSFVGTRKKLRVTRSIPNEVLHNGFVLCVGHDWLIMHQFHDFFPEGLTAVRVKDIVDLRSSEFERHWERMLAAEGILDQLTLSCKLPVDDIRHLLQALQQLGNNVIVECEDPDEEIEDFYIGQILSVDDESLCFANFDGMGRWDEAPHTIPLEEITKLQIDSPYMRTFSKYLEGPCPKRGAR